MKDNGYKNACVTSVASRKGGVGKSTATRALSQYLCTQYTVLVIDLDSQANFSKGYGYYGRELPGTISQLLWEVMNDANDISIDACIQNHSGVDFIPCNENLADIEIQMVSHMEREMLLQAVVSQLKNRYDYIFLDTGPALGLLTLNALTASDSVLIVTNPEKDANDGAALLLNTIAKIRRRLNPSLKIEGILVNEVDRYNFSLEKLEDMKRDFTSIPMFRTTIPRSVYVGRAREKEKNILEFNPSCKVSQAYRAFGREFLDREA